jgi:diguanylate cyclase (GGDEF)-like protein
VAFVIRRLLEERRDVAGQVITKFRLREYRRQASLDPLTDLANRRSMLKALKAASMLSPGGPKHALLLVDLDDFKRVNDLHGHAFGDRVLQIIAQRFRAVSRPSDLLVRLGGDEFALLCYDVDRDTALAIARRLLASLEGEIRVKEHPYRIGASIGVALIPDDGKDAEEIIHHADLAMYRAKGLDQSSIVFFEPNATYRQQISTDKS